MWRLSRLLLGLTVAFSWASAALAGEVKVAVAANFAEPARVIAARFQARTGHTATLSLGSSGQFATQIMNGAPFDVFLSADRERPEALERQRLAVADSRFTYAIGRLVLFSRTPGLIDSKGAILARGGFEKLAVADPATAPYGAAAVAALGRLGLIAKLQPRIVTGASIAQAYQFVDTGAAEVGFVALSQVKTVTGGSRWLVPARLHPPIDQQAVLLTAGARNPAASAFVSYLRGPEARAIIQRYGYEAP